MKRMLLATAAALFLTAGAASATPAITEANVNMRTGPGTGFQVITTLPRGVQVEIRDCSGGWCAVFWNGRSGYVSANFLDIAGGAPPAVVRPAPSVSIGVGVAPVWGPSWGWGPGWGSPGWNSGWHGGHRPPPGGWHGSGRPPHAGRPPGAGRPPHASRPPGGGRPPGAGQGGRPQGGFAGPPANWRGNPGIPR